MDQTIDSKARFAAATNRNRFTFKVGIIHLLNRCIEGIHIYMNYLSYW